jgi:hypothetical protein
MEIPGGEIFGGATKKSVIAAFNVSEVHMKTVAVGFFYNFLTMTRMRNRTTSFTVIGENQSVSFAGKSLFFRYCVR